MTKRKFARLKGLLYERSMTQDDAARHLGRGRTYVARRMNGQESWTFEDAATLAGVLDIPCTEWADYFMEAPPRKEKAAPV